MPVILFQKHKEMNTMTEHISTKREEERQAIRELVKIGLALIEIGAPTISEKTMDAWFMSEDKKPFPTAS